MTIDSAYDLMRQSANALALLHCSQFPHLNIKPDRMTYDQKNDLSKSVLKIIGLGNSYRTTTMVSSYDYKEEMKKKTKTSNIMYSPPEVIREMVYDEPGGVISSISQSTSESTDVYCWAMSFYQLLLRKTEKQLCNEVERYKKGTRQDYEEYLKWCKKNIKELKVKSITENNKKEFIISILCRSLDYDNKERPKIKDIILEMKQFEQISNIEIDYRKAEDKYWCNIKNALAIDSNSVLKIE